MTENLDKNGINNEVYFPYSKKFRVDILGRSLYRLSDITKDSVTFHFSALFVSVLACLQAIFPCGHNTAAPERTVSNGIGGSLFFLISFNDESFLYHKRPVHLLTSH